MQFRHIKFAVVVALTTWIHLQWNAPAAWILPLLALASSRKPRVDET